MIPLKIEKWLSSSVFPQRVMLSGMGDNIAIALEIAARLQGVDQEMISKGLHADTTIFRDKGKSRVPEPPHRITGMIMIYLPPVSLSLTEIL